MDSNNWRTAQGQVQMAGQAIGGEAVPAGGMEGGDWRTQLQQDSRQRIVNKIMGTLRRHLPCTGEEGPQEIKKIAVRFEEKIYTAATSQSDYLRKISLKMLTMETESQNPMANSLQPNAASNSRNPQDPAFEVEHPATAMASEQSESQLRQPHLLSRNTQTNINPSTGINILPNATMHSHSQPLMNSPPNADEHY